MEKSLLHHSSSCDHASDDEDENEEIYGDEVRFKQILINLVKLALERSSSQEGSEIRIVANHDRPASQLRVKVQEIGTNIPCYSLN